MNRQINKRLLGSRGMRLILTQSGTLEDPDSLTGGLCSPLGHQQLADRARNLE